jgi:DNA repair protein RecO (recombination protein O)
MQITTKAIVLSSLKYGDTSLIVKAFTEHSGLKSYLLQGVLSSKKGKLKTAYFQPLMQLEIVAIHKNKGTLERIVDVAASYHYLSLHTDIAKNALSMFLAEMLCNSILEEERNQELFQFLEASLQWLDTHGEIANFHLYFLLRLTKYLGFYPDRNQEGALYFDLMEGAFTDTPSVNPMIMEENIHYFKRLLGIQFDGIHQIGMGKTSRRELLKSLVLYYELHLQGFRKPRSLAILNEVFN